MTVSWLLTDPQEAATSFACGDCGRRFSKGDALYLAKQGSATVKLCEECAELAQVEDDQLPSDDRDSWLGEL